MAFATKEPAGTLIVDTPNTYLYYVLGGGRAIRYGVRVGRDGFTWTGVQKITRKAEWPDWHPPPEMIDRQPYLPRFMAGGPGNPLGARAMYLGNTVYRIHGTNQPSTIGKFVSSGCIGMLNEDVSDLFDRVKVGTRVVVLPGGPAPPGRPLAKLLKRSTVKKRKTRRKKLQSKRLKQKQRKKKPCSRPNAPAKKKRIGKGSSLPAARLMNYESKKKPKRRHLKLQSKRRQK